MEESMRQRWHFTLLCLLNSSRSLFFLFFSLTPSQSLSWYCLCCGSQHSIKLSQTPGGIATTVGCRGLVKEASSLEIRPFQYDEIRWEVWGKTLCFYCFQSLLKTINTFLNWDEFTQTNNINCDYCILFNLLRLFYFITLHFLLKWNTY